MARYFNVAGPCNEAQHYMIEAASRLTGVTELIDQCQYFVIHAPRQSGKTTLLLDLANRINHEGKYYALYCSLEAAQGVIEPEKGIPVIVKGLKSIGLEIALEKFLDVPVDVIRKHNNIRPNFLQRIMKEMIYV
ncbi:hypothetical protein AGMMS4956_21520 [Bacteroidia bacterium]|nr:hypothetical protein AGMMS4956_21520 [Bacteroidia bacterium]